MAVRQHIEITCDACNKMLNLGANPGRHGWYFVERKAAPAKGAERARFQICSPACLETWARDEVEHPH